MDRDARPAGGAPAGDGDLGTGLHAGQAVEEGCRPVGRHRVGPGGEDGRQDALVPGGGGAGQPVHAGVERHEPALGPPVVDGVTGDTCLQQLPAGDDAVPGRGRAGDDQVGSHAHQRTRRV